MSPRFPSSWSSLKTNLAHDWLTGMRGGERVLELLCDGFDDAELYTLLHKPDSVSGRITRHPVRPSRLNRAPRIYSHYRYYLPFFPGAVEALQTREADLQLSTSHCVAKGLVPQPGTPHLCYCFTPMRYAWTFYEEYFGTNPVKKAVLSPVLARLRDWDRRVGDRVNLFVGISQHVRERIRRCYDRDADVVYPPVDTERCTPGEAGHDGFDLIVSALVPYKRVDLAVRAYTRLGYPLKVVGTGTEYEALRKEAGPQIEFTGWLPDESIVELYRRCRCLVFPGEEDFGIVPVEVQACGKPVVAYGKGGALETVVDGVSGVFFNEQTEESLLQAVETCAGKNWDAEAIRNNALRFSEQAFIDGLATSIEKVTAADPKQIIS